MMTACSMLLLVIGYWLLVSGGDVSPTTDCRLLIPEVPVFCHFQSWCDFVCQTAFVQGEEGAYFYADIIGVPGDPAVDRALEECAFHSKELRLLGTYEQARKRG